MRVLKWIIISTLYFPYLYLLMLYSFFVRARIVIKSWPTYNHPDPKTLGFDIHHYLTYKSGDLIIVTLLSLTYVLICFTFKRSIPFNIKIHHLLFSILGLLLFVQSFSTDVLEWFAD